MKYEYALYLTFSKYRLSRLGKGSLKINSGCTPMESKLQKSISRKTKAIFMISHPSFIFLKAYKSKYCGRWLGLTPYYSKWHDVTLCPVGLLKLLQY